MRLHELKFGSWGRNWRTILGTLFLCIWCIQPHPLVNFGKIFIKIIMISPCCLDWTCTQNSIELSSWNILLSTWRQKIVINWIWQRSLFHVGNSLQHSLDWETWHPQCAHFSLLPPLVHRFGYLKLVKASWKGNNDFRREGFFHSARFYTWHRLNLRRHMNTIIQVRKKNVASK